VAEPAENIATGYSSGKIFGASFSPGKIFRVGVWGYSLPLKILLGQYF
jgi:hypothetical protein